MTAEREMFDSGKLMWLITKISVVLVLIIFIGYSLTTEVMAEDEDSTDFSFYKIASAAASYYDDSHNPSSDNYGFALDGISIDMAGAFVGFVDEDYDSGLIGSTISYLSSSSQSRSYDSFEEQGMQNYVLYGHALSSLGLDSTANESFDIMSIVRALGGWLLAASYTTALVADLFFLAALSILNMLNPFSWFINGVQAVSANFANWFNDTPETIAALDGVSQFVTQWYSILYDLGMFITFFLFIITLAACILLWNSAQHGGPGKAKSIIRIFFTRLVFICLGIPLLGGLYTASITAAKEQITNDGFVPAANYVISATLVDFEAWVLNDKLALPSGVTITVDISESSAGVVDAGNSTSVRQIAKRINARNSNMLTDTGSDDEEWSVLTYGDYESSEDGQEAELDASAVLAAYDVLYRYMSSAFYHASDYETYYKARVNNWSDVRASLLYSSITEYSSEYDQYDEYVSVMFDKSGGGRYTEQSSSDLVGDSITLDDVNSIYTPYFTDGGKSRFSVDWSDNYNTVTFGYTGDDATDDTDEGGSSRGLSTLAMYNYLTTKFDDSSVVVYSSHKATSAFVLYSHRSVNLIGDGVSSFLYWGNAISMLIVITVIGVIYSIGMVMNQIGRSIRMVSAIPFALLGNMKSMAKVVTYVAMMMIEILGTFFVYSLVIELLLSLSGVVETPLLEAISDNVGSTIVISGTVLPGVQAMNSVLGTMLSVVGLLVSTLLYIWFGAKAIRLRKSILKAMDEMVAGIIDRVFTVQGSLSSMSNAQGAGSQIAKAPTAGDKIANAGRSLAGGVAAGAGAALTQMGASKAAKAILGDKENASDAVAVGSDGGDDGGAENAGGTNDPTGSGGATIEGVDRQGLPGPTAEEESGQNLLKEISSASTGGDAKELMAVAGSGNADVNDGRAILASGADSLGDLPTNAVGRESTKGVVAGESANASEKDRAADGKMDAAMGKTTAVEEEADVETKKELKKEGAKEAAKGVAKAAVGAAQVAAGAYTGDVQMMAKGTKNLAEGTEKAKKGADMATNASTKVDAARAQANDAKESSGGARQPAVQNAQGQNKQGGQAQTKVAQTNMSKSSFTAQGGARTSVNKSGPTNINMSSQGLSAEDAARMNKLRNEQKSLERAREQVRSTGRATLPNGRTVHNTAEVDIAIRRNKSQQSAISTRVVNSAGTASKAKSTSDSTKAGSVAKEVTKTAIESSGQVA